MRGLEAILKYEEGNFAILKEEKWLLHLAFSCEENVNLERVERIAAVKKYTLEYVKRTLRILSSIKLEGKLFKVDSKEILEIALSWCEVAKTGMYHTRKAWINKGFCLFAHNIGSCKIYREQFGLDTEVDYTPIQELCSTLILTHGLIGQYLRGETSLISNQPLVECMEKFKLDVKEYKKLLMFFNECIIGGVSPKLWEELSEQVDTTIDLILTRQWDCGMTTLERLKALRKSSIQNGEDFNTQWIHMHENPELISKIEAVINRCEIWYVEAALHDFSFEEFIKILLLISKELNINEGSVIHLSFEKLMNSLYYDRNNEKKLNLYKKRIIENYLKEFEIEQLLIGKVDHSNIHVKHCMIKEFNNPYMLFFEFQFSPAADQLIQFCEEAEKADVLYEKAIILLYDLFDLRRDAYDRFYEEEAYLQTMNQSIDYKAIILEYIVGQKVVDIGPGGGALMDLIEKKHPSKQVIGVDISENVLDNLKKRKQIEGKSWEVQYGDALELEQYFERGSVDTVIFCSILHELFSYIPYEGERFHKDTVIAALKSAFNVIPTGGRIIIRDGIMTEPSDQKRMIRFLSEEGLQFLKKYKRDFKGRNIQFEIIAHNMVLMPVNDAMEFLYTYTWGDASYVHEINEQFGYFTPSEYITVIQGALGSTAKVIEEKHYLQQGYTVALSSKIEFFNEDHVRTALPDSTCFIVIEKI
ncbi:MAG: SAM-dependent methyltransferase [Firmicutes bacterium HGW-Firmicutes-1]|jgi:hypothetical protein|nr:MAG: SAM-dependent methyltransferase [Firmicutes bacterium HGW-Firmicutes-1]